jgi:hypothetical protein
MMNNDKYEVDVQDAEYQSLAGKPWLARIYKPKGKGPFPTIIDVHGGAWHNGDRTNTAGIDEARAASGILVAALDFRQPPEAGYPASVCDVNLAVRWLKAHAAEFNGTTTVGAFGNSSGGHQVVLAALRLNRFQIFHERLNLVGRRIRAVGAPAECVAPGGHVASAVAGKRLAPVDNPRHHLGRKNPAVLSCQLREIGWRLAEHLSQRTVSRPIRAVAGRAVAREEHRAAVYQLARLALGLRRNPRRCPDDRDQGPRDCPTSCKTFHR